ncbi:hypothetical protein B9T38_00740 [Acinetobacter sp. ANC 4218]|nr:hypothetical protein B9T38_00740 [Acinetobacter sp. ANC 4218]
MKIQFSLFANSVKVSFALKKVYSVSGIWVASLYQRIDVWQGVSVSLHQSAPLMSSLYSIGQQEAA